MISVIIRNKNEERWIGHAIQSCLDHFVGPEILIVDNHSTDKSLEIAREFCFSDIKIHSIEDYTPGKALNYGCSVASYDNILVLSAHSQITKMDYEIVESVLENNVAVFGKQTPVYRGRKINRRYVWSHFVDEPCINMWSKHENRSFLHNAFCFYRKEFLLEYPFDEYLASKEDRYWAKNIVDNMLGDYYYEPTIECNHHWTRNGATWKGIG